MTLLIKESLLGFSTAVVSACQNVQNACRTSDNVSGTFRTLRNVYATKRTSGNTPWEG